MINRRKIFSFILFFFIAFCSTACELPNSSTPDTLHVTLQTSAQHPQQSTWTITDAQSVSQLYQEAQHLPQRQAVPGRIGVVCSSSYALDFLTGSKSLHKYTFASGYCSYLDAGNGRIYTATNAFKSHLATLLHISVQQLQQP
jgi:hypothetical protein